MGLPFAGVDSGRSSLRRWILVELRGVVSPAAAWGGANPVSSDGIGGEKAS